MLNCGSVGRSWWKLDSKLQAGHKNVTETECPSDEFGKKMLSSTCIILLA